MRREAGASDPSGVPPRWAVVCFLASGAAGLLYEVVWSKVLSQVMGNSLHAISTVIAVFLAGLALGAWWGGRRVPPARAAARYARLELGIAALGAISVPLLRGLDLPLGALHGPLGGGAGFLIARFALVAAVLLPPTVLMGATLPVLVGGLQPGRAGGMLARLYAINTAGAVAGTALGGFALIPIIGLVATALLAAALNALAALFALRSGPAGAARTPAAEGAVAYDATQAPAPATTRQAPGLALALGLSGFAALLFQIAWVRLYANVLGSSVYSFSGVLAVYLAGLAIGSAWIAPRLERLASLGLFARLQVGLAVATAFAVWVFPSVPEWYLGLVQGGGGWVRLQVLQLGLVAALVLVPCILLGALFPLAVRLLGGEGSRAVGTGYALNTIGTITGALAGGYLIVPRLGMRGTHVLALSISVAVGVAAALAAWRAREPRARTLVTLAGAVLAVVVVLLAPRWDPLVMSSGVFRPARLAYLREASLGRAGSLLQAAAWRERVLFAREGEHTSVLIVRDSLGGELSLRLNGKVDASTGDMLTQVLLGLVPAAFAEPGARTLIVGCGSGVTLGAALAAGAGRTDLVELEPAVLEASKFFHAAGENPLYDPRVHIRLDDGRNALARSDERFALIVSEPSNPWLAGVNNLFTEDFYRLARSRLARGGVFCQWLQVYEISPGTFGSILASFFSVFPRGQAFVGTDGVDLVLCASDRPLSLDVDRFDSAAGRKWIGVARLPSAEALAAYYLGPFDVLRPFASGRPLNRDDRPIVEFRAPRDLVEQGLAAARGVPGLSVQLPLARWRDANTVFAGWTAEHWWSARGRELARNGKDAAVRELVAEARAAGDAAFADTISTRLEGILARRRGAIAFAYGRQYAAAGELQRAALALAEATRFDPASGPAWGLLAESQRLLGDLDGAEKALAEAMRRLPAGERFEAHLTSGFLAMARGRPLDAARSFGEAGREKPNEFIAFVYEARARFDARDTLGARRALKPAIALAPNHPDVRQARAAVGD